MGSADYLDDRLGVAELLKQLDGLGLIGVVDAQKLVVAQNDTTKVHFRPTLCAIISIMRSTS